MSETAASDVVPAFQPASGWKKLLLILLSVGIVHHLFAITMATLTVGPSSRTAQRGWERARVYLQGLYLNHGFHYFAPNPPEHASLIRYEIEIEDGERIEGEFPNRDIEPRLMYHRHFMMSETLGSYYGTGLPIEQELTRSYATHLLHEHDGTAVELWLVRHFVPTREEFAATGTLQHESLYNEFELGRFTRDTLLPSDEESSP